MVFITITVREFNIYRSLLKLFLLLSDAIINKQTAGKKKKEKKFCICVNNNKINWVFLMRFRYTKKKNYVHITSNPNPINKQRILRSRCKTRCTRPLNIIK